MHTSYSSNLCICPTYLTIIRASISIHRSICDSCSGSASMFLMHTYRWSNSGWDTNIQTGDQTENAIQTNVQIQLRQKEMEYVVSKIIKQDWKAQNPFLTFIFATVFGNLTKILNQSISLLTYMCIYTHSCSVKESTKGKSGLLVF